MLLLVACPRCRQAKVVEAGRKTTTCGSCSRTLTIADLRVESYQNQDEASEAVGRTNATLARREGEWESALVPSAPRAIRHDGPLDKAAAATRKAASEKDRADAVARSLGDFSAQDLAGAFALAGLRRPEEHLQRMLATSIAFEPRAGRYRAL